MAGSRSVILSEAKNLAVGGPEDEILRRGFAAPQNDTRGRGHCSRRTCLEGALAAMPTAGRDIRRMFDAVAPRYDLLNHLLSGGLDRRWRRRAAAAAVPDPAAGALVADVCCGTADLALAALARGPGVRVVGLDFSRPMLARARAKLARAGLLARAAVVEADALSLPLADASVDAALCGFGLRNLADTGRGLAELARVVRPGGRVVVLEFHQPRPGPLAALFNLYFRRILPRLGGWISGGGHGAYGYLVASIEAFGPPQRTARAMAAAGLADVTVEPLPGGIASVYTGRKP
jgi:demethylmenaquinone methyltransferase/2-methoxy-6-polyprenyl-1,4-benzoquinol methylase